MPELSEQEQIRRNSLEEIEKIAAQQVALEQQKEQEKIDYFNRKYKIKSAIE